MNILIPHTWLLEHLETQATPDQIQELLSLSGPSVERIYEREGEPVYDIEITTNRVDCMSVRGIAREAAVILTYAGIPSKLKPLPHYDLKPTTTLPLPQIADPLNLSKRLCTLVLDHANPTPTPEYMAKRLHQIDQNIHNSLIDITNYVTHELGHPCHAFDYEKIIALGGQINITKAQPGQKFTTLDELTYETHGGEIVFTNPNGLIIDLPAIKGTLNTAIDSNTHRILLWIESLPADAVRQASMTHNTRTIAAELNEKKVDPQLAMPTLFFATHLYQQLTSANIASEIIDIYPQPDKPPTFQVSLNRIEDYLGLKIPSEQIVQILTDLGCQAQISDSQLTVTPPSFRPDLTMAADIVEEIARIYGYHNLPSVLMSGAIPTAKPQGTNFDLEFRIKNYLAASGFQEVYTYSLVSQTLSNQESTFTEIKKPSLRLANPLTEDRMFLRQSLIPSLAEVFTSNKTASNLQIFEIANVYLPTDKNLPLEQLHLTLMACSHLRSFRTHIDHLLASLFIPTISVTQNSPTQATIFSDNQPLGHLHALTDSLFSADFIFNQLIDKSRTHPKFSPTNPFPPVIQDFTFEFNQPIRLGDIITVLQSIPNVAQVEYLDSYQNRHTFRLNFQSRKKNLTATDIQPLRDQISQILVTKFQARLI